MGGGWAGRRLRRRRAGPPFAPTPSGVGLAARRYGVPLRPPGPPRRHDCRSRDGYDGSAWLGRRDGAGSAAGAARQCPQRGWGGATVSAARLGRAQRCQQRGWGGATVSAARLRRRDSVRSTAAAARQCPQHGCGGATVSAARLRRRDSVRSTAAAVGSGWAAGAVETAENTPRRPPGPATTAARRTAAGSCTGRQPGHGCDSRRGTAATQPPGHGCEQVRTASDAGRPPVRVGAGARRAIPCRVARRAEAPAQLRAAGVAFPAFFRKPMSSYTGVSKPKEPVLARSLRAAVSWGRW